MKDKYFAGVDPGSKGALCILDFNGKIIHIESFFKDPENPNLKDLKSHFEALEGMNIHIVIEDVHALFGSSASSTWNFGKVCGAIEMAVVDRSLSYTKVAPKTWQKEMFQGIKLVTKPSTSKKTEVKDTKAMSYQAVSRIFPEQDFHKVSGKTGKRSTTVIDDNLCDAALMAEYCRRKNL